MPFLYANKENIQSLEINGHTSSEWGKSNFTDTYLNNKELSLNRSYDWLTQALRGSGYSSSQQVKYSNIESKKKSRRVIFKVILK